MFSRDVLTLLPDPSDAERAETFQSPFDERGPSALARRAAAVLQHELRSGGEAALLASLERPGGGKMFGVLVAEDGHGRYGFLRAFSGMLAGRFDVPGYAPPIFDRAARKAIEPAGEAVVKQLLAREAAFASSPEIVALRASAIALAAPSGGAGSRPPPERRERSWRRFERAKVAATRRSAARSTRRTPPSRPRSRRVSRPSNVVSPPSRDSGKPSAAASCVASTRRIACGARAA